VGFGLSNLLKELHLVETNLAFLLLVVVVMLDSWLLYRFFAVQLPSVKRAESMAIRGAQADS
jgi:hypothetical protein